MWGVGPLEPPCATVSVVEGGRGWGAGAATSVTVTVVAAVGSGGDGRRNGGRRSCVLLLDLRVKGDLTIEKHKPGYYC